MESAGVDDELGEAGDFSLVRIDIRQTPLLRSRPFETPQLSLMAAALGY
jgi:hypothetical protein